MGLSRVVYRVLLQGLSRAMLGVETIVPLPPQQQPMVLAPGALRPYHLQRKNEISVATQRA